MRTLTLLTGLTGLTGLLLAPCASADALQDGVIELIAVYNQHQEVKLPLPDDGDLAELMAGSPVAITQQITLGAKRGDQVRVVGYRLYQRPRAVIWVSALYKPLRPDGHLIEHLTPGEAGSYRLYQYLPLPWPLKDRHWAISVDKAIALAQSTEDEIWEHRWQLTPDGKSRMQVMVGQGLLARLDAKHFERAVYLPLNRGGWTAFKVSDNITLLAIHMSTVLSGSIPDSWVARYTRRRISRMMDDIDAFAANVDQYYDAEHFLVFSGSGEPIYPAQLRDAGSRD